MDHSSKLQAETVFAGYHTREPPAYSSAFRPADDDGLLIQPKKLVNPVLESKSHVTMQRELKLNNKLGINVLNQKSELAKVFQEKQRDQLHQNQIKNEPQKSEFELMLEKRKKESDSSDDKDAEASSPVPEFLKMKEKLRKA